MRRLRNMTVGLAMIVSLVLACSSSGPISSSNTGAEDESTLVVLLTTAVGALSTTGGVLTTNTGPPPPPSIWLGNRRQIQIDLARGGGDWINDLASELGLPDGLVHYLGEAVLRNRKVLAPLLAREPMRVDEWERRLGDALCCDPWLHPFAERRFMCRAPREGVLECTP